MKKYQYNFACPCGNKLHRNYLRHGSAITCRKCGRLGEALTFGGGVSVIWIPHTPFKPTKVVRAPKKKPSLEEVFKSQLTTCCDILNELLEEAKIYWPEATLYLAGSHNLHLLSGDAHDNDRDNTARRDRIIATATLKADGGDW